MPATPNRFLIIRTYSWGYGIPSIHLSVPSEMFIMYGSISRKSVMCGQLKGTINNNIVIINVVVINYVNLICT